MAVWKPFAGTHTLDIYPVLEKKNGNAFEIGTN